MKPPHETVVPSPRGLMSPSGRNFELPERATSIGAKNEETFVNQATSFLLTHLRERMAAYPYKKLLVGLSGGTTPGPVYQGLREVGLKHCGRQQNQKRTVGGHEDTDFKDALDLRRVIFFLIDERYISPYDKRSNTRMIRETLFGQIVDDSDKSNPKFVKTEKTWDFDEANFIWPNTSLPIDKCVSDYLSKIKQLLQLHERPDILVLGLGDDGHTASIFPPLSAEQYNAMNDKKDVVVHTTTDRFEVHDRVSLNLAFLETADIKIFLLKGINKVEKWYEGQSAGHNMHFVYPANQIVQSGGTYVFSYPSFDDYAYKRQRRSVDKGTGGRFELMHPPSEDISDTSQHLTIVVMGASGDLAKKKTYPAIFSLFCEGLLPSNVHVIGYARSSLSFNEFWETHIKHYMCDLNSYYTSQLGDLSGPRDSLLRRFKERCSYMQGTYHEVESMKKLDTFINVLEKDHEANNRLLYLALPPDVFATVVSVYRAACWSQTGWNRVVVEKPFGRDSESSEKLSKELMKVLDESETYRIDHYLGKEMTLSLLTLRFANVAIAPLFHTNHVQCVRITFKEDIGTFGRGGYFDKYGIIRDVMQNHMLQLLTLIAMEPPASLNDEDIRDEKVKVLKQILPIKVEDSVIGQYTASADGKNPGYLDDPSVPKDSLCPTFCTSVLWIRNERWKNVPFVMKAGKALKKRSTEIRIQLRPTPYSFYPDDYLQPNELVFLVQPREAVYIKLYTKKPGLTGDIQLTELDLSVMDRFQVEKLPDAYERLLLDVIRGDKQNFVRTDELREAWRIFTPMLKEIEGEKIRPLPYVFGTEGPESAYKFIQKFYTYRDDQQYSWVPPK